MASPLPRFPRSHRPQRPRPAPSGRRVPRHVPGFPGRRWCRWRRRRPSSLRHPATAAAAAAPRPWRCAGGGRQGWAGRPASRAVATTVRTPAAGPAAAAAAAAAATWCRCRRPRLPSQLSTAGPRSHWTPQVLALLGRAVVAAGARARTRPASAAPVTPRSHPPAVVPCRCWSGPRRWRGSRSYGSSVPSMAAAAADHSHWWDGLYNGL